MFAFMVAMKIVAIFNSEIEAIETRARYIEEYGQTGMVVPFAWVNEYEECYGQELEEESRS